MPDETDEGKAADHDERAALRARVTDVILNTAANAVVVCDRDGIICLWNPGATRIFGFAVGEAVGQSLDIIIPDRLQARHWEGFHKMICSGQSQYPEGHLLSVPGRRKDGSQCRMLYRSINSRHHPELPVNYVKITVRVGDDQQ